MKQKKECSRDFVNWYIKGEYHCDKCPFCWESGCDYETGEVDDCGCYIFKDLRDTCRLVPPFRFILGWAKRKKAEYYYDHEYDDIGEWYVQRDIEKKKYEDGIKDILEHYGVTYKYITPDGIKTEEISVENLLECEGDKVFRNYTEFVEFIKPFDPPKKICTIWKDCIVATFNAFVGFFKPYFCK